MAQTAAVIAMSFDEVDTIVKLPPSARMWWANEDVHETPHVQCKAWQTAGYDATANMRRAEVIFQRKDKAWPASR